MGGGYTTISHQRRIYQQYYLWVANSPRVLTSRARCSVLTLVNHSKSSEGKEQRCSYRAEIVQYFPLPTRARPMCLELCSLYRCKVGRKGIFGGQYAHSYNGASLLQLRCWSVAWTWHDDDGWGRRPALLSSKDRSALELWDHQHAAEGWGQVPDSG